MCRQLMTRRGREHSGHAGRLPNREGSATQLGDNAGDAAGPRISGLRAEHRGHVGLPGAGRQLLPRSQGRRRPVQRGPQVIGNLDRPRRRVEGEFDVDGVAAGDAGLPAPFGENGSRNLPPITATVERYSNPLTLTTTAGRLPAPRAVTTSSGTSMPVLLPI